MRLNFDTSGIRSEDEITEENIPWDSFTHIKDGIKYRFLWGDCTLLRCNYISFEELPYAMRQKFKVNVRAELTKMVTSLCGTDIDLKSKLKDVVTPTPSIRSIVSKLMSEKSILINEDMKYTNCSDQQFIEVMDWFNDIANTLKVLYTTFISDTEAVINRVNRSRLSTNKERVLKALKKEFRFQLAICNLMVNNNLTKEKAELYLLKNTVNEFHNPMYRMSY